MKIRHDFVTNSSSSSFIIGKKDDESVTVDSVYDIVRGLYQDKINKRNIAIEFVKEHPELRLTYKTDDDGFSFFKFNKGYSWNDENKVVAKLLEDQFGVSVDEYFHGNYEWLEYKTYADYEKYWLEKMQDPKNYKIHAPFTITDFLEEKPIKWLHYYSEKELHKVDSTNFVLDWYYPYIEEAFSHPDNCEDCKYNEWCDKEECIEAQEDIRTKNIPEDKACLYMLGRVCIYSECGYILDSIVNELKELSEYSCNHMG